MVIKSKTSNKNPNKLKSSIKPKKNFIKNGLIATGVLGALTGISLLGVKNMKEKKNLQEELIKTSTSNSDKKIIESLNKCLSDIDNKEKLTKDIIEKLAKKSENDNKIIIDLQKQISEYKVTTENLHDEKIKLLMRLSKSDRDQRNLNSSLDEIKSKLGL